MKYYLLYISGRFQIRINGVVVEEEITQLNVIEGTSYSLECIYQLNSNVSVKWEHNLVGLPRVVTDKTLIIQSISRTQSGGIQCKTQYALREDYTYFLINVQCKFKHYLYKYVWNNSHLTIIYMAITKT